MKRTIYTALLAIALTAGAASPGVTTSAVAAGASTSVYVNGTPAAALKPIVDRSGVYLPFKPLFAPFGYTAAYDETAKLHVLAKPGTKIVFAVGSRAATVNGKTVKLSAPARAIGGTVYVPLRFAQETAKIPVVYDREAGLVQFGSAFLADQFFRARFGMTVAELKKLIKTAPSEEGQQDEGYVVEYHGLPLPQEREGYYTFSFEGGKLDAMRVSFMDHSGDFEASMNAYAKDKTYLDRLYNGGDSADDVQWNVDDEERRDFIQEYKGDEYKLIREAITFGVMNLEARYARTGYTVHIHFTNVNWDEADDPFFIETLTYAKK
ncbi:copper amine oxidase N-terminal domain-containing protein [Paenibacillus methanolicus]|uniref:Copper amine oxidase-like protein n=1 Tax=Paenibacillus methanolicus TaxID=582686 RepID=A0A5S5C8E4_9BACL|nr:copper amine oxidase N-terminal domain-containing protein [Paenibacillus methanolicus]TYP74656.1 copper amine oxidase-like protein [Paenibacillus methanolicus]